MFFCVYGYNEKLEVIPEESSKEEKSSSKESKEKSEEESSKEEPTEEKVDVISKQKKAKCEPLSDEWNSFQIQIGDNVYQFPLTIGKDISVGICSRL